MHKRTHLPCQHNTQEAAYGRMTSMYNHAARFCCSVQAYVEDVGRGILPSWTAIAQQRSAMPYTEEQRNWQLLRCDSLPCGQGALKSVNLHPQPLMNAAYVALQNSNDSQPGVPVVGQSGCAIKSRQQPAALGLALGPAWQWPYSWSA